MDYEWISTPDSSTFEQARQQVYNIFLERSSILFNNDETRLWLKQVIGYLLNKIESEEFD